PAGKLSPRRFALPKYRRSTLGLDKIQDDLKKKGVSAVNSVKFNFLNDKPITHFYTGVWGGDCLGVGVSGEVRKANHKITGTEYAIKRIPLPQKRSSIEAKKILKQLRDEIEFMCELDHPSIVKIHEVYEAHSEVFIVQELYRGGDIFDYMAIEIEKQDNLWHEGLCLPEKQCASLVKQMLLAAQCLHSKGIVHRDIKTENFMFPTKERTELKMIDFGLSCRLDNFGFACGAIGTRYSMAPEVLQLRPYNETADIWSIGILAFLMLDSDTPFGSLDEDPETMEQTFTHEICSSPLVFRDTKIWSNVSEEGKSFIRRLLRKKPTERPSAAEALEDPWITRWS
ncbi:MAG: hypothetical protein SGILL_005515, partial [Bacillariaceae sp.]